jgi:acyltransferase
MQPTPPRVQFLDLLRGVAVVIMVMGHSLDAVLSNEVRASEVFKFYDSLRGFTAPLFLLIAGFAFSIATEKKWEEYRTFGGVLRRRLVKMGFLLVLGYVLHIPFFSFNKLLHGTQAAEFSRLFQVDVLHCLSVSILLLHVVVWFSPSPALYARWAAGLAASAALVAPIVWGVDMAHVFIAPLAPYFNQREASIFPFFPYAAFLFVGAAIGHHFLVAQTEGLVDRFRIRLAVGALSAIIAAIVIDRLPFSFLPPHDYWKASPDLVLLRTGIVAAGVVLFSHVHRIPGPIGKGLTTLGRGSLLVYVVHLTVAYGSAVNAGLLQRLGQNLQPIPAISVAILVLFSMVALVYGWTYLRKHHTIPTRIVQVGLTSALVYVFFTSPF